MADYPLSVADCLVRMSYLIVYEDVRAGAPEPHLVMGERIRLELGVASTASGGTNGPNPGMVDGIMGWCNLRTASGLCIFCSITGTSQDSKEIIHDGAGY